jgi:ABC-type transport system substrate-binding protein
LFKLSLKKTKSNKGFFKNLNLLKFLPRILNKKEKSVFSVFLILFIISGITLGISIWQNNTEIVAAQGGILREGIVGQPRFINPVYASSNDIDRDLVNLIYSGLFKYDAEGNIVSDLVKEYFIEENGKIYNLILRQDALFHDDVPLTADDIIFTIETIQNPDFQSPIQAQWLDVKVEKISDYQIKLSLKNPYPAFLETLCLKILPAHIWKDISSQNFPLCNYNFQPIGSGPFRVKNVNKDKNGQISSLILERNSKYYNQKPYLSEINFIFFNDQSTLLQAAENNIIDSLQAGTLSKFKNIYKFKEYSYLLPRYYALFFNSKEKEFLNNEKIRTALNYATNKEEIISQVFQNKGEVVSSPFLPNFYHFQGTTSTIEYNKEKALEILEKEGFQKQDDKLVKIKKAETMNFSNTLEYGDRGKIVEYLQECLANLNDEIYPEKEISGYFGPKTKEAVIRFQEKYADEVLTPHNLSEGTGKIGPSTREKLNEVCVIVPAENIPLEINITTSQDQMLVYTAEIIKKQWEELGFSVQIKTLSIAELKQKAIKERDYEAILFGQVLGIIPDPFPFWHSSQRIYPGLNLSYYKNEAIDKLLEEARAETEQKTRFEKYAQAEKLLLKDSPAIFLYNPNYLYLVSDRIKGIKAGFIADSCQRFAGIENWYIKTKRVFK